MKDFEVEKCKLIDPTTVEILIKLNAVSLSWVKAHWGLEEAITVREPCNAEKFILAIKD